MPKRTLTTTARRTAALAAAALVIAGCGTANKAVKSADTSTGSGMKMSGGSSSMPGMNMGSSPSMAGSSASSAGSAAAQETKAAGAAVDGITPVPTQTLATTTWQGMKITAMAMTAVPFVVFNGTSEQEIKPTKKTSFHLMVMLNDAQTNVPIPYAEVWATITNHGKLISDERTWPMISRYMGPHYGEDVSVPGAGTYGLSLLVTPPVSGRHLEYANVWTKPHRVNFTFHWTPPAA